MKTAKTKTPKPKKPATRAHHERRRKVEALALYGVEGEREAAKKKLDRLDARFDFTAKIEHEKVDMFFGTFEPSPVAKHLCTFTTAEMEISAAVKWAIETATNLRVSFRGEELLVEASLGCLPRLVTIADRIAQGFRILWHRLERAPGITPRDRGLFFRGLYDGMMQETRPDGEALPARHMDQVRRSRKRNALATAPGLGIHPYSIALDLGKQLRFETPLTDIVDRLEDKVGERKQLA